MAFYFLLTEHATVFVSDKKKLMSPFVKHPLYIKYYFVIIKRLAE